MLHKNTVLFENKPFQNRIELESVDTALQCDKQQGMNSLPCREFNNRQYVVNMSCLTNQSFVVVIVVVAT